MWLFYRSFRAETNGTKLCDMYGILPGLMYFNMRRLVSPLKVELNEYPAFICCAYIEFALNLKTDERYREGFRLLMSYLPSTKVLKILLRCQPIQIKNCIFFKVMINFLITYHKRAFPLFTVYRTKVLPLAYTVYDDVTDSVASEIVRTVHIHFPKRNSIERVIADERNQFMLQLNRKKYLGWCKKEMIEFENLAGGYTLDSFYF